MTTEPASPRVARPPADFLSDKVRSLKPSGIRRFFDMLAEMKDVISLTIGEPDFTTPEPITRAAIASLEAGETHYTANGGMVELREAIVADLEARYGISYHARDELIITVGASEAVDAALRAICDPGDEVIYHEPTFVAYAPCITLAGGVPVAIATGDETDFRITAAQLEAAITPRTKALFLAYPNNPTGAVLDREQLDEIAAVVERHDLMVITDEIYERLVYGGHEHVPFSALPGMWERTVLIGGFSKSYAMTGWRIGFCAGPKELVKAMDTLQGQSTTNPSAISQAAALAALTGPQDSVAEMHAEFDRRRKKMTELLRAIPGVQISEPRGAFYCFPDLGHYGKDDLALADHILEKGRVAVVPGTGFFAPGFVRLSYATSMKNVEEGVARIAEALKAL